MNRSHVSTDERGRARAAVTDVGFDVENAPGTGAALDRLDSGRVDCVVTDHDPSEVDGVALAERLAERRSELPVVFHPTDGSESLASRAVAAGVSAYLPGDEGPEAFDGPDVEMAELLVAHTARTLDRLRHDAEFERQNERLEEFAGVVSHDLRNPLNVAQARLELAREERDGESANLEAVAGALSCMDVIVDDTLTLARQGRRRSRPNPSSW
ncbi:MAG: histidine kinase dimerization/phospho-acceptor domain-containing protein [Haloarculaceae archaeon]